MLYLAIDQHKHHLTVNTRNEQGEVMQKGQILVFPQDCGRHLGQYKA